jgi:hypothetical protein
MSERDPFDVELDRLRAENEALRKDVERMRQWIEGDCLCPCCQELRKCSDGCTFYVDAPSDAERMTEARSVLFGT